MLEVGDEEDEHEGRYALRGAQGRAERQRLPRAELVVRLHEPADVGGGDAEARRRRGLVFLDEVEEGWLRVWGRLRKEGGSEVEGGCRSVVFAFREGVEVEGLAGEVGGYRGWDVRCLAA